MDSRRNIYLVKTASTCVNVKNYLLTNHGCILERLCHLSDLSDDIEVQTGGRTISTVNALFRIGQQISFICADPTAILQGRTSALCTEDGTWSSAFPSGCGKNCA